MLLWRLARREAQSSYPRYSPRLPPSLVPPEQVTKSSIHSGNWSHTDTGRSVVSTGKNKYSRPLIPWEERNTHLATCAIKYKIKSPSPCFILLRYTQETNSLPFQYYLELIIKQKLNVLFLLLTRYKSWYLLINEYPGKYHTLREHNKIHRGLTYTAIQLKATVLPTTTNWILYPIFNTSTTI